jgi:hypothetical protein
LNYDIQNHGIWKVKIQMQLRNELSRSIEAATVFSSALYSTVHPL